MHLSTLEERSENTQRVLKILLKEHSKHTQENTQSTLPEHSGNNQRMLKSVLKEHREPTQSTLGAQEHLENTSIC